MLNVEGRAIRKGHHQEKCKDGSMGSTAPVSTPAMQGLWSCTTSFMSKENLYPAEHQFIHILKDSNDLDKTPYVATTEGFPLYKGSYRTSCNMVPLGFQRNQGDHFISFPIKELDGDIQQAEYVQVILHPNPIIMGLCNDSDKVYTKPLYAVPIFHYDGKLVTRCRSWRCLR